MEYLIVVFAYLLGAIPFGLLIAKARGIDLRKVGSGNIGTTNVLRAVGKKEALITLAADILKGTIPVVIAKILTGHDTIVAMTAAAAVIGHDFSIYLGFKGGKGVATSLGVVLGLKPLLGVTLIIVWILTALCFRYSSLSALVAFAFLLLFSFISDLSKPIRLLMILLFALIYFKHRSNIKRLVQGVEPKLGQRV
ncbi:MAG: glycerol-3-phosphate 1-O-acyltransferase PlsY [Nitrospirae bacterium]|nr:glycerol-3-phosphate 1-O-acyltransferase PlsY [Nitrospirota bacterium]